MVKLVSFNGKFNKVELERLANNIGGDIKEIYEASKQMNKNKDSQLEA